MNASHLIFAVTINFAIAIAILDGSTLLIAVDSCLSAKRH